MHPMMRYLRGVDLYKERSRACEKTEGFVLVFELEKEPRGFKGEINPADSTIVCLT